MVETAGSIPVTAAPRRAIDKARARRRVALDKAAPKSLNPYASDDSDAASDGGAGSDGGDGGNEEAELDDEAWAKGVQSGKTSKGERLTLVDHSTIEYRPFRKVRPRALQQEICVALSRSLWSKRQRCTEARWPPRERVRRVPFSTEYRVPGCEPRVRRCSTWSRPSWRA